MDDNSNSNLSDDERQRPLYHLGPQPSKQRLLVQIICVAVASIIVAVSFFWAGYTLSIREMILLAGAVAVGWIATRLYVNKRRR